MHLIYVIKYGRRCSVTNERDNFSNDFQWRLYERWKIESKDRDTNALCEDAEMTDAKVESGTK